MSDAECPYCGHEQEICHDDGYGYDESQTYEQRCYNCEKIFAFTTSIHFHYETSKADCLNGGEHKFAKVVHHPENWPDWVHCTECGHEEKGEFKRGDRYEQKKN